MRKKALYARLRKREYSFGELIYAVDRLADDPDLDEKIRYGGDLSAADFRRVIEPIQTTRKRLLTTKLLTKSEMWTAIETVPTLERNHFGACRPEEEARRFVLKSEVRDKIESSRSL